MVNAIGANLSGAGRHAIQARIGAEVVAENANGQNAGGNGVFAFAGKVVPRSADLSGATDEGIKAQEGGHVLATFADVSGSGASNDVVLDRGNIVTLNSATTTNGSPDAADVNIALNSVTSDGIVFG